MADPTSGNVQAADAGVDDSPMSNDQFLGTSNSGASAPAPAPAPASPQNVQPAAQPPAQPAPGQVFKNISHSFMGAILGGLAGKQPTKYVVDSTGKTVPDPNQPQATTGDKLRSLATNALQGLAAGTQVGPQKSRAAALAAGLGAGAEAKAKSDEQKDDKSRKVAGEDYERQQQQILRQHDIAKGNMANLATMQHINQEELDHDPQRQANLAIAKAAEDSGIPVKYLTESEAQAQYKQDPKTLIAEHILLPAGNKPVLDGEGNPTYDENGTPKMEGQLIAINGMHDGNFTPPSSFIEDAKKYGKLSGVSDVDSLSADQPMSMENFTRLHTAVLEGKKLEMSGWAKPEQVFGGPDGKTPMQRNTATGEMRVYPKGVVPNVKNEPAESAATVDEKDAQAQAAKAGIPLKAAQTTEATAKANESNSIADKNRAETDKLNKDAKADAGISAANAELHGDAYLKTLDQGSAGVIRAIGEGRETRSARQLQDKNGEPTILAKQLHQAYPDFDITKASAYGNVRKDFTSGNTSRALTSYGTAMSHMRSMYDNTGPNSYLPGTDEYKRYNQDVTYVATEVAKALAPQGTPGEKQIQEQEDALRSTINRRGALENAEAILTGKMPEIKQRWQNAQPIPSKPNPMPGLSQEAKDNAAYVRNHGRMPAPPAGMTHKVPDANGILHWTNPQGTVDGGEVN